MDRSTALLLVLLAFSGCDRGSGKSDLQGQSRSVTLALNWFPEAEHGGFYAALVHGYFEQEGLRVQIRSGGPGAPVIHQVAGGQVDFAIANADQVLLGRDQGAPVVAVMAPMQNSPRCIMVHEKSGIDDLLDLRDLTLAVGSGKPYAKFLLGKLGDARLNIVPYQGNVAMFLQRDDFAQQAYVFSEPHVARQQGGDPRCLMVSDLGFNPYAGLLITNERKVGDEPDLVNKFVRACARGWRKYLDDPDETNDYIHIQNEEMGSDILAFGAEAIRPLCLPTDLEPARLGRMTAERWETLAKQLAEIGLLENVDAWRGAYASQFLPGLE